MAGQEDFNKSYDVLPDTTQSEEEKDDQGNSLHQGDTQTTKEADLRNMISEAQRELAVLAQDKNSNKTAFVFTSATTEQERNIARAEALAVKYGLNCQKLGESSWCNERYADIQKQFQATPVFTSLKINNILAEMTPNSKSLEILEKFDLTLGVIINGLIQQKMIFQNLVENLPTDIKNTVSRDLLAENSEFRKNSDALLKYVCDQRAEVIKLRREVYKPPNEAFRDILHDIPPSETHLFEDKTLRKVVKELGGVHKLFAHKKRSHTNRKLISQVAKPNSSQITHSRFRNTRNTTKRNSLYTRDGKGRHQKPFSFKTHQRK